MTQNFTIKKSGEEFLVSSSCSTPLTYELVVTVNLESIHIGNTVYTYERQKRNITASSQIKGVKRKRRNKLNQRFFLAS